MNSNRNDESENDNLSKRWQNLEKYIAKKKDLKSKKHALQYGNEFKDRESRRSGRSQIDGGLSEHQAINNYFGEDGDDQNYIVEIVDEENQDD